VEAHYGLAYIYSEQGKFDQALTETNLLLQVNPNFALGYYQLGSVYENLGRKKEAVNAYQRYLELQPSDPKAIEVKQLIEKLRMK
jgi:tetratricopeptide (TPR) repeat protein